MSTEGCGRRRLLEGLVALGIAPGCRQGGAGATRAVEVPLDSVPVGGRRLLVYEGEPAEIWRKPDVVEARFLSCTHFGCVVSWSDAEGQYLCACHEGRFHANGRPAAGPPTQPLRRIPLRVEGGMIRLGVAAP